MGSVIDFSDIFRTGEPVLGIIFRSLIVYCAFVIALRVFGKREIGQFTPYDLALLLLVTNALQPAITGNDRSLSGGVIVTLTLFGVNQLLDKMLMRFPKLRDLITGQPIPIVENGQWIESALKKEGIDSAERSKLLRQHGHEDVSTVRKAILETDGTISIFPYRDGGK